MKKICSSLLFLTSFYSLGFSQTDREWVFDDSVLPEVHILIEPDSLDEILRSGNEQSDYEFPATFVFKKGVQIDTLFSIGFRLRGNTSRNSAKKSFKVSFNTFEKGRKYRGLEKMNLNGEHNDPTIMRAKVSWDIFEKIGLPAPKANHVTLYINNEYFGLYLHVEHIDEEFVQDRFRSDAGNLYKSLYPADLSYISNNQDDYKWSPNWANRRVYDLKTNTDEDDYSDLAFLISFLETASSTLFEEEIENYLNVDGVLRWMAVDILTGNWDNYWYNQNNFYLYNNPIDNRFEFIPYDYDNTLGIDFLGPDWGTRDINDWGQEGADRPLVNRILEVQEYRNRLNFYIERTIEEVFNEEFLFPEIDRLRVLTATAAVTDIYRTLDYGFDIGDYHTSFTSELGGHVKYGLKPYITARIASALNQVNGENIRPIIRSSRLETTQTDSGLVYTVYTEVIGEALDSVYIHFKDIKDTQVAEFRIGRKVEETDINNIYIVEFDSKIINNASYFAYNVEATDKSGLNSEFPKNGSIYYGGNKKTETLLINEFMADNETGIQDNSGKFEDWIELYNPTDQPVSLKNYFLTDDFFDIEKWAFPDTTIAPNGFLLIWADNDDEEGPLHTSFSLSNDGEELAIYFKDILETVLVDSISFGPQSDDVSFGRETDGAEVFASFSSPTPGTSNTIIIPIEEEMSSPKGITLFQNYPNPFNPETIISFQLDKPSEVSLEIFTIEGRLVQTLVSSQFNSGVHSIRFDASSLSSGMYFYRLNTENQSLTKRLVLIK